MKVGFKSFKKIWWWMWARVAHLPMPGNWRWRFVRLSGVTVCTPPKLRAQVRIYRRQCNV